MLAGVLALSGCSESEEQVLELRQLREKLAAAEKKASEATAELESARQAAEAAAAAAASTTSAAATDNSQALAAAVQKAAEAEERAASMQKKMDEAVAAAKAESGAAKGNADSFREFVKTMERDLLSKTSDLQQAVEQALPDSNIQDTTVKRLRLPENIATAFSSAVVFNMLDAAGQPRRLEFPVQAGLDGQWRMPGIEDVRQHIAGTAASTAPVAAAPAAPQQPVAPATPAAVPAAPPPSTPVVPASAPGGGGVAPTIVVQWDNAPAARPATTAAAPAPAAPPPAAAPAPAVKPAPPAARPAPKALMPVQQDVQIRFE